MKPIFRKVDTSYSYSFSVREDICPYFDTHWYYHPELELTLIRRGSGMQFVGDHIGRFNAGDIVLLGGNLPHLWKSDDKYYRGDPELQVEAVVIHFTENFWGAEFLNLPELKPIKQLLEKAKRGIRIYGEAQKLLKEKMELILNAREAQRIEYLLNMLHLVAVSKEYDLLSSVGFIFQNDPADTVNTEKINKIYNYTFNNFQDEITIKEVAAAANISPNYFCRYFKSQINKTYWQFLLELRIGYACKLLLEGKMNVTEICYTCGFSNLSNFNRQFKALIHKTPLQYRRDYFNV